MHNTFIPPSHSNIKPQQSPSHLTLSLHCHFYILKYNQIPFKSSKPVDQLKQNFQIIQSHQTATSKKAQKMGAKAPSFQKAVSSSVATEHERIIEKVDKSGIESIRDLTLEAYITQIGTGSQKEKKAARRAQFGSQKKKSS